jgi:hypothetical protein
MPGQLPANVEYRRRNKHLHTIIRRGGAKRPPIGSRVCNGKLIRNLLVRFAGGDEAQHDDFCCGQGLIAHVLGDLERDLWRQAPLSSMDRSDRLQ